MSRKVFASAFTDEKDADKAVEDLVSQVREGLGTAACDLVLFFVSEGYEQTVPQVWAQTLMAGTGARHLLGCNASGVIGRDREIEMQPGMSALAMHLDGAKLTPFSFTPRELGSFQSGGDMVRELDLYQNERPHFLCLGDPLSCDASQLLKLFHEGYPQQPLIGGMASAVVVQAETRIWLDGETLPSGVAGLAVSGELEIVSMVSQGCRPVGTPLAITKAEQNILYEIAGRPALKVLQETYESLSPDDQELARHSLFAGLAMDELADRFSRGDFLIRNIVGADQQAGALAIGEVLQPGQTLQFQLRDRRASEEDLQWMLARMPGRKEGRPEGALLVSCCGRGKGLFGEADHDVRMVQAKRGPLPLAGFFANGEFGPVKGRNYIHGYTSSLTIFR